MAIIQVSLCYTVVTPVPLSGRNKYLKCALEVICIPFIDEILPSLKSASLEALLSRSDAVTLCVYKTA